MGPEAGQRVVRVGGEEGGVLAADADVAIGGEGWVNRSGGVAV